MPGTLLGLVAAGPWNPKKLPNLIAWYDFSDTSTITASAGAVSAVADKSGNGFNLAQVTSAKKPVTGSHTLNSRNVLFCTSAGGPQYVHGSHTSLSTSSTLVVVKLASSSVESPIVDTDDTGNRQTFYGSASGGKYQVFGGTAAVASTQAQDTTAHVWCVCFNPGSAATVYMDGGTNIMAGTNPGSAPAASIRLGADAYDTINSGGNMDIAEVVRCSGIMAAGDRAAAFVALKAKWATP